MRGSSVWGGDSVTSYSPALNPYRLLIDISWLRCQQSRVVRGIPISPRHKVLQMDARRWRFAALLAVLALRQRIDLRAQRTPLFSRLWCLPFSLLQLLRDPVVDLSTGDAFEATPALLAAALDSGRTLVPDNALQRILRRLDSMDHGGAESPLKEAEARTQRSPAHSGGGR